MTISLLTESGTTAGDDITHAQPSVAYHAVDVQPSVA